jgi:hypothetical protein
LRALALLLLAAGCYDVNAVDRGWQCTNDNSYLCPAGLVCDTQAQLCVKQLPDMSLPNDGHFVIDLLGYKPPTSCDLSVRGGKLSGLTNLATVNTAADEWAIALTPDGSRLYFMSGTKLMTSAIDSTNPKSLAAAQTVTITGAPTTLLGGGFTSDGTFWLAGNGGSGATTLYAATATGPTAFTASPTVVQSASCPFYDPAFYATSDELYVAYPLGGCNTQPFVARGATTKNLGAFYGAFAGAGYRAPSLTPSGLTLLYSSSSAPRQLFFSERATTDATMGDTNWSGPSALPLGGLGAPSGGDWQAAIAPDCKTLYLVADRAGGKGGADLWAADISP